MIRWGDLFSSRQTLALATLAKQIRTDFAETKSGELLALTASRLADFNSSLARWAPNRLTSAATFGRQALPMLWDYCETVPLSGSTGSWQSSVRITGDCIGALSWMEGRTASVEVVDAAKHSLPSDAAAVWMTDPPYYDAIPYADLSDFFFVWLKRALPVAGTRFGRFQSADGLTPKGLEIVQDESKEVESGIKDSKFFEDRMRAAFEEGRRITEDAGLGCVVFAHKSTEGWEALLGGLIRARWVVTASWPIATERPGRLRAQASAALATSVHLVCRPRPDNAGVGDWANVLRELPNRVGDWMERLQGEGIRGADLVFACIGPALEIFSRYEKVETADGCEVALAEYLEKVWEVVGRSALSQVLGTAAARARNGAAGAVEEDARLTALFLWTLQSTNGDQLEGHVNESENEEESSDEEELEKSSGSSRGYALVFDVVRRFAQPLGIELPKWEGRIIDIKKGMVRLLPVVDRASQLFGADGAHAVATRLEHESAEGASLQGMLFPELRSSDIPVIRGSGRVATRGHADVSDEKLKAAREATTLDRVHAAMLLQAGGRTNALRALLRAEQERSPDFLRLANALSALYPKTSEEKRLLDAMLLAVPR
jgi:hypothetical protein